MFFYPLTSRGRKARRTAKDIYAICVAAARQPQFFSQLGIPDSFNGRFEMVALHTGIVINGVNRFGRRGAVLGQAIFDEMFLNMEVACRQAGISDISVPKQIKRMMKALQGRASAYDRATTDEELKQIAMNNVYSTAEAVPTAAAVSAMVRYIRDSRDHLRRYTLEQYESGYIRFGEIPNPETGGDDKNTQAA